MHESPTMICGRKSRVTAARVLDAIRALTLRHHQPPTVRELCAYLGTRSTGHMHYHLLRLEAGGFLRPRHHRARSLRLVATAAYPTPALGFSVPGNHDIEPVLEDTPFVEIRPGDLLYTIPTTTPAPGFAFGSLAPRRQRMLVRILAVEGTMITLTDGRREYRLAASNVALDAAVHGVYRALSA
jgi:LexA DNA binding domain